MNLRERLSRFVLPKRYLANCLNPEVDHQLQRQRRQQLVAVRGAAVVVRRLGRGNRAGLRPGRRHPVVQLPADQLPVPILHIGRATAIGHSHRLAWWLLLGRRIRDRGDPGTRFDAAARCRPRRSRPGAPPQGCLTSGECRHGNGAFGRWSARSTRTSRNYPHDRGISNLRPAGLEPATKPL